MRLLGAFAVLCVLLGSMLAACGGTPVAVVTVTATPSSTPTATVVPNAGPTLGYDEQEAYVFIADAYPKLVRVRRHIDDALEEASNGYWTGGKRHTRQAVALAGDVYEPWVDMDWAGGPVTGLERDFNNYLRGEWKILLNLWKLFNGSTNTSDDQVMSGIEMITIYEDKVQGHLDDLQSKYGSAEY